VWTRAVPIRATAGTARVQTETEYDSFGNTTISTRYGCIEGCPGGGVDEVLTGESTFALHPADDSGWLYREQSSFVSGDQHTGNRQEMSHEYDKRGQLLRSFGALSGTLPLDRFHESGAAIAPAPADQSDGAGSTVQLQVVEHEYDAFGHALFSRTAGGGCGSGELDPLYAQLPTIARAYAGEQIDPETGCGDKVFESQASYDRGLQAPISSTDANGSPSQVEYDGFGRLVSATHADPDSPEQLAPLPAIVVAYELPEDASVTPYSHVVAFTLDGLTHADNSYAEAHAWSDGLGRTIASLSPADPAAGDGGAWVVSGDAVYNAKGLPAQTCLPWFTDVGPDQYPSQFGLPIPSECKTQEYDAFGRPLNSYDGCGDLKAHIDYHAMSQDVWDANDLTDGTYVSASHDGHGRGTERVERIVVDGSMELRRLINEYLPTGEVERVTQRRDGSPDVVRWMRYDSLGRMVLNVEPNTSSGFTDDLGADADSIQAYRYAYDDAGLMVGYSDARGCGANFHYDLGGRLLATDHSPCLDHHAAYTAPDLGSGDGTEALFIYDEADPDSASIVDDEGTPFEVDEGQLWGRLASVSGPAAKAVVRYDGLGRPTGSAVRIQRPGPHDSDLSERYAPRWYVTTQTLDAANRTRTATTGVTVDELKGDHFGAPTSELRFEYTARGLVAHVDSSYGRLFDGAEYSADGLLQNTTLGDPGQTRREFTYTCRREVDTVLTNRGAAPLWSNGDYVSGTSAQDPTQQISLEHAEYERDEVGNITRVLDLRDESEWPDSAKPVTRSFEYDDLYRLTQVTYEHSGGDTWKSPYDRENRDVELGTTDPSRPLPSPHQSFSGRVQWQSYSYDWLGNIEEAGDDRDGFWDRSTGDRAHGTASAGPHRLQSATNRATGSASQGDLDIAYDAAGNLTDLIVRRDGTCLPVGASCYQRFHYEWDEVGQLSRARRWDLSISPDERTPHGTAVSDPLPVRGPDAELLYHYDAGGSRTLKTARDAAFNERHTVYVTGGLELRSAVFDTIAGDYVLDPERMTLLLPAGPATARVIYSTENLPHNSDPVSDPRQLQHVFLELADHLGSTSFIIDRDTGELVEFSTYQAYGAIETDYRPPGWDEYREPYKFGGKEEDIEVGLLYFGARFYSPYLGVWMSPDPVTIHDLGSDTNPYSYVAGRPIMSVDPDGREVLSLLGAVAIGALIGAATSAVTQAAA
ncbi:MAG: RHS repeat-associated core domain-containing protein, partial [Myxococcales bacterium]|nr:RHS repeat-associated core domain-containing protein [Myxococcales bacterium]